MLSKLLSSTKFSDTLRKLKNPDNLIDEESEEEIKRVMTELGYDDKTATSTAKEFINSRKDKK